MHKTFEPIRSNAWQTSRNIALQCSRCSKAERIFYVIRLTCSLVSCLSRSPNWCGRTTFCALRYGVMLYMFSNNLDSHDNNLIGLFHEVIVWSFPGFGMIMTLDFFHLFWKYPSFVIPLNSLNIKAEFWKASRG